MDVDRGIQSPQELEVERARLAQAGVELRAGIDTETVRGLQLINGGLAAGLVTMLPTIVRDPNFKELGSLMVVGIMCAVAGLVAAIVHNRLRRKCSLEYTKERSRRKPPFKAKILVLCQTQPGEPRVCTTSILCMWASVFLSFVARYPLALDLCERTQLPPN